MQLQMLLKSKAGPPVEAAWLPTQGDQLFRRQLQAILYIPEHGILSCMSPPALAVKTGLF